MAKNAGSDHAQTYLRTHDIGSGPYELTTAQTGTKYGLTQFDGYWGTKSPFTTVDLPVYQDASALQLAFDSGDVSVIVAALPSSSLSKYEKLVVLQLVLPAHAPVGARDGQPEQVASSRRRRPGWRS